MGEPAVLLGVVWAGLTAYAVFGGADFGAGVWDLLSRFTPGTVAERRMIQRAIGPVWEANHVWLIFVLVGLFAGYPRAFAALTTGLWLPLSLALLGIVARGVAFVFRAAAEGPGRARWGWVFAVASSCTPPLLAAAAAGVAAGHIRLAPDGGVRADALDTWTSPLSLLAGALAVAASAFLAATYLAVDARREGDGPLAERYRRRSVASGVVAGGLALGGLLVVRHDAPLLWDGLTGRALPLIGLSVAAGVAAVGLAAAGRVVLARPAAALAVAAVVWGWGAAQWPFMIVPDVTVHAAAAPEPALQAMSVVMLAGAVLLLPSLWLLFRVFKGGVLLAEDRLAPPRPRRAPGDATR